MPKIVFNELPDDTTCKLWLEALDLSVWQTESQVQQWTQVYESFTTKEVGYEKPKKKPTGLELVFQFIAGGEFCLRFLEEKRQALGWRVNMTHYIPVTVSSSVNEMVAATVECYRMMIKQALPLPPHLPEPTMN